MFSKDFNNDFRHYRPMTKEEIKALIALKIEGQGTNIDGGSGLAPILYALLDKVTPDEVADITAIDGATLDALAVGDTVAKVTGKQKHLYVVTYKGEGVGEGLCLTYWDASVIETVSYDYTDDGWVYNSTDKWEKPSE